MENNVVIDEKQASAYLGLAVQSLRNRRCRRQGPPYHKLGGRVVYRVADLEAYLDAHRIDPEAGQDG